MGGGPDEVKETAYQKELANIATEKWNMSKQNLQPLEDMMIAKVSKGVTDEQRAKTGAAANVASQKQFGQVGEQTLKELAATGVDPTSGKFREAQSDISRSGGETMSASQTESEAGLQSNQLLSEMNLLRAGAGEATQAQASMSDVARRSAQKAEQEAAVKYQENQGLRQLAGTLAGAAGTYYAPKKG